MNQSHALAAIVTLVSLLVYVWMILRIGGARRRPGIDAPAMTGHPELERHLRIQANTVEWLVIYLPSLWLFALYWNDRVAAALGVVWMIGRIVYALGYAADPKRRELGFIIQALATGVLLFGALGRAVYVLMVIGG